MCPRCQRGRGRWGGGGERNKEEREKEKERERKVREEKRVAIFTRGLSPCCGPHGKAAAAKRPQVDMRK